MCYLKRSAAAMFLALAFFIFCSPEVKAQFPVPNCVCAECGKPCGQGHKTSCSYYVKPGPGREPREPSPRPESNTNISIRHSNAGYEYEKAGNWMAAENEYRKAIQYYPNWYGYHFVLARVFANQGRYNDAIQSYKQSIALNPRYSSAYNNIGVILSNNLDRDEEAEQWFLKAHQLDPTDSFARNNLVRTVKRIRQKVLDNNFSRAFYLSEKGESAKAESLWRKYLLVNPNNANAWNNLGATLAQQRRYLAAEAAYREAVRLDPSHGKQADNLKKLMESDDRGNSLKQLMAASEQGMIATKELDMEAMKGRAMSCFDFNEDATKTIRCAYSKDSPAAIALFAPRDTRQLITEAPPELKKDPKFIELAKENERLEKDYGEAYDALQELLKREDSGQGSTGMTDVLIAEQKQKLSTIKNEQNFNEVKIQERYVDLGFRPPK